MAANYPKVHRLVGLKERAFSLAAKYRCWLWLCIDIAFAVKKPKAEGLKLHDSTVRVMVRTQAEHKMQLRRDEVIGNFNAKFGRHSACYSRRADSPDFIPSPSPFLMRIFSGKGSRLTHSFNAYILTCMFPAPACSVLPYQITFLKHGVREFRVVIANRYILQYAKVMHGGTLTKDKEDNRNAAYFFCDGSSDPWFGK